MKITVITGSPHKDGTSALLTSEFIKGATEAGHSIYRFDAAFNDVHACMACEHCHETEDGCVFKDGMEELKPHVAEADMLVFASPIYYYNICAQLKAVMDRFYSMDKKDLNGKKLGILMTCEDDVTESVDGPLLCLKNCAAYLKWDMLEPITALACPTRADIEKTDYPKKAYEFGKSL